MIHERIEKLGQSIQILISFVYPIPLIVQNLRPLSLYAWILTTLNHSNTTPI